MSPRRDHAPAERSLEHRDPFEAKFEHRVEAELKALRHVMVNALDGERTEAPTSRKGEPGEDPRDTVGVVCRDEELFP